jgi:hypothetical protein
MVRRGNRRSGIWGRLGRVAARGACWRLGQSPGRLRGWVDQWPRGLRRWPVDQRRRWRRVDQPPGLWRWRRMGQSMVSNSSGHAGVPGESVGQPLVFLPAAAAIEGQRNAPFVVTIRSRDELICWLREPPEGLQWLQVEGLLSDREAWSLAAQDPSDVPLDIILSAPGAEFSDLYRLVEVSAARDVRVSIPAVPGFLKAVWLGASLGFPIRLLPGQPSAEAIEEMADALDFYLHDPAVEAPVEFFHSVLAWMHGATTGSLWRIVEEDPAVFRHDDVGGRVCRRQAAHGSRQEASPTDFVRAHLARLVAADAECATCRWQPVCQGYFKWPDAGYSCRRIKQLFSTIENAAGEIRRALVEYEGQPTSSGDDQP